MKKYKVRYSSLTTNEQFDKTIIAENENKAFDKAYEIALKYDYIDSSDVAITEVSQ